MENARLNRGRSTRKTGFPVDVGRRSPEVWDRLVHLDIRQVCQGRQMWACE